MRKEFSYCNLRNKRLVSNVFKEEGSKTVRKAELEARRIPIHRESRTTDGSGMQCEALHESEQPGADPVPTFLVGTGDGMAPNDAKKQV
jgi:hypothetical protein